MKSWIAVHCRALHGVQARYCGVWIIISAPIIEPHPKDLWSNSMHRVDSRTYWLKSSVRSSRPTLRGVCVRRSHVARGMPRLYSPQESRDLILVNLGTGAVYLYNKVTPGLISRTIYVLTRIHQQTFFRPNQARFAEGIHSWQTGEPTPFSTFHIPIVSSPKTQDPFRPAWMLPDILISSARFPESRFHPQTASPRCHPELGSHLSKWEMGWLCHPDPDG